MRMVGALALLVSFLSAYAAEPAAVSARKWEKKTQARLLAEYREWMERLTSTLETPEGWIEEELKALDGVEKLPLPKEKIRAALRTESARRYTVAQRILARLGETLNANEEWIHRRADSVARTGTGADELSESVSLFRGIRTLWDEELRTSQAFPSVKSVVSPPALPDKETLGKIFAAEGKTVGVYWKKGDAISNDAETAAKWTEAVLQFLGGAEYEGMAANESGTIFHHRVTLTPTVWEGNRLLANTDSTAHDAMMERYKDAVIKRAKAGKAKIAIKTLTALAEQKLTPPEKQEIWFNRTRTSEETSHSSMVVIEDEHGRDLAKKGIELIDWDGNLANPARRLRVRLTERPAAPIAVAITTPETRLYFDKYGRLSSKGPSRLFHLSSEGDKQSFLMGIQSDRDGKNEEHDLKVTYWESTTAPRPEEVYAPPSGSKSFVVPISVADLDRQPLRSGEPVVVPLSSFPYANAPRGEALLSVPFPYRQEKYEVKQKGAFSIVVDFTLDKSGFFDGNDGEGKKRQEIVRQAADDWAYLLDEINADSVETGDETTTISTDRDTRATRQHTNRYRYRDFVIFALGTEKGEANSLGGSRGSGTHTVRGRTTSIRRSGQILVEGVDKPEGFFINQNDQDWWKAEFKKDKEPDLTSLVIHELGHALVADRTWPEFKRWLSAKQITEPQIQDYHGGIPVLDETAHLAGEVDRECQCGAFGAIDGNVPQRRWRITKLDALMLPPNGYRLKANSAWDTLTWYAPTLADSWAGARYSTKLVARGGLPPYLWRVAEGQLPDGLALDSFTGEISGKPEKVGEYHFVVELKDSSHTEPRFVKYLSMQVKKER